jgi:hypothetical protein
VATDALQDRCEVRLGIERVELLAEVDLPALLHAVALAHDRAGHQHGVAVAVAAVGAAGRAEHGLALGLAVARERDRVDARVGA